ncbi:hypothetical protein [Pedobacter immunditicola]|uniref:hypothetical protein n=1 Tax=Pedobacter immunditicola TaxID=3133440 RepID=UPI0030B7D5AE
MEGRGNSIDYDNKKVLESTGWEKVYVPKITTGSSKDISLLEKDLNIITSLTIKEKTYEFEEGKVLTDYLKIELIDKTIFDSKKATAVDFLLVDTTLIYKKIGVIELPTANGIKKFIDKPQVEISGLKLLPRIVSFHHIVRWFEFYH